MNQIVDFAIRIQDMASSQLREITNEWTKVADASEKAKESAGGLGGVFNSLKTALKAAAIGETLMKVGSFAADAIQASLDRKKMQVSFDVLTGSKEAGAKLSQELVDLQKNTILGGEVFEGAQTLMGFGMEAEKVTGTLKKIGDVSMGDAEKFKSLSLAFAQVSSAGKLQGQDLMQLINAGWNPLNDISAMTGKSIGQLKDEMSKGAITSEMLEQALEHATGAGGKFENMLGQMAETNAGKVAQLQGAWEETKIKIGESLAPVLSFILDIADRLLPVIDGVTAKVAPLVEMVMGKIGGIKEQLAGMMDYVNIMIGFVQESILPVVMQLWALVKGMVGDIVTFVANSEILKDVFAVICYTGSKVASIVKWLFTALKDLWDLVIMPILNAIEKAYRFIKGSKGTTATIKTVQKTIGAAREVKMAEPEETTETLKEIAKNTSTNNATASKTNSEIAGSGPKVVNINVQKFFDNIQFTTTNLNESAAKIEETVLEVLGRVLVQGAGQSV